MNPIVPPALLTAAGILAAVSQVWFWRRTSLRGVKRTIVMGLRLGAIGLLSWITLGPERPILETADDHPAVVLRDISRSMDFPGSGGTRAAEADYITRQLTGREKVRAMSFGARLLVEGDSPPDKEAVRGGSLAAGALRELLTAGQGKNAPHSVVLISDGAAQDAADLAKVAPVCRQRGIPVSVICTGGDVTVKNVSLVTLDAQRRVKPGTRVPITVTTRQTGCDEALRVELVGADGKTVDQGFTSAAAGQAEQSTTLYANAEADGFTGTIRIAAVEGELTLTDNEAPVRIGTDKAGLRVLYMEGSLSNNYGVPEPCFLPQALAETGDIEIDLLCPSMQGGARLTGWAWKDENIRPDPSKGYPRTQEELNRYDVVICSDIPRQAFTEEQIRWTVDLVAERGGGFVMVGGSTSFGAGYWDRTPWERMIPVDMDDASRGSAHGFFDVFWPEEGKRHPLLAQMPLQEGEKLNAILEAHPYFEGTNVVHRAKPAATVLMRLDSAEGQPLIAVQPFGKGRSMAFTSDITYQWGTEHRGNWGPPEGGAGQTGRRQYGQASRSAGVQFNNSYYKRFWQRTVRWLAENSVRVKGSQFEASTPYLAWPGQAALAVRAGAPDESMMSRLAGAPCIAQVRGMAGTRTKLNWDAGARRFTGTIARPPGLTEEVTVDVEATDPLQKEKRKASFTVTVPRMDAESAEPSARPDILAALADATGGKVLHSAGEASAWLESRVAALNAPERAGAMPAWDRTWVLAAVLVLLSADWIIRRFYT